ncbi:protein phosphatase 1 regulatory subunit 36-like isoform X2 [Pseudomyrmex gracilis]|uniref:protein phosphatase 1 regulatory subunit 36-like isoform X2 n=1 Tax=Pseudomyrmex gracilis TaxID=219809 RepID=UPI000994C4F6|nr:protein phosphatase 1 regulatory subunit 36-like isoform X2 [Pseudomyrmex gracilis]
MGERHFVWDEVYEGIVLSSTTKAEDDQAKGRKKEDVTVPTETIYFPHAYLSLSYRETLSESAKIRFRRHYLRKVAPNEPDVIILQDIKDLVLYLLATPVSPQFVNFLHLTIVDRFLRALIIYFQHYTEIWEDLMQEQAATMKKAPNPLARGHRFRYAEQMRGLRCLVGREYVDLIMGCQEGSQYHHMMNTKSVTESQGEKDLRIFEALISVAHRVVWIALKRKHYNLIELEVHRLFRTEAYNTAQRQSGSQIIQDMLEDDIRVLHGPKMTLKSRLLRNSPLPQELIYSDCDYRFLSLGVTDIEVYHPTLVYLKNALHIEEERLSKLGIKAGILGHNRSDYDIMLMPVEPEEPKEVTVDKKVEEPLLRRFSMDIAVMKQVRDVKRLTIPDIEEELPEEFPMKEIEVEISNKRYDKVREEARKKWIRREIKRRKRHKQLDTYSEATTID